MPQILSSVRRSGKLRTRGPLTDEEKKAVIEKDHKMVKGIFRCYEPKGGSVKFSFKKHKCDEVLHYEMFDGETMEIPFMVAHHLNKNCSYPKHKYLLDMSGKPTLNSDDRVQRFSFESGEYQMML